MNHCINGFHSDSFTTLTRPPKKVFLNRSTKPGTANATPPPLTPMNHPPSFAACMQKDTFKYVTSSKRLLPLFFSRARLLVRRPPEPTASPIHPLLTYGPPRPIGDMNWNTVPLPSPLSGRHDISRLDGGGRRVMRGGGAVVAARTLGVSRILLLRKWPFLSSNFLTVSKRRK